LLETQIERILVAIGEYENVHVLVSSNGEPIENFPKLSKLIREDHRFDFRSNPSNIGGNANILLGFVLAQPEDALWILADDNPITKESVSIILENLESEWDILGMTRLQSYESSFVFDNDKYGLNFLGEKTEWGLISSVIYNISSMAESINNGFELFNSSFPHLAILLEAANKRSGLQVVQIESKLIHEGNVFQTGTDYAPALTGSPILFAYETKKMRRNMSRRWLWKNGSALFGNRNRFPQQYVLTKILLRKWCGLGPFYLLFSLAVLEQRFYESKLGVKLRVQLRNSKLVRKMYQLLRKPIHILRNS
jgi:hypothetical protein